MTKNIEDIDAVVRERCIEAINKALESTTTDGVVSILRVPSLADKLGMNLHKLHELRRNKIQRKLILKDVYSISCVTGISFNKLLEGFLDE